MNYLLERYDIIVSDRNQTHEGMSFWQARMYDALELGLHLYGYDMMTCELIEMNNEEELEKVKHGCGVMRKTSKTDWP